MAWSVHAQLGSVGRLWDEGLGSVLKKVLGRKL